MSARNRAALHRRIQSFVTGTAVLVTATLVVTTLAGAPAYAAGDPKPDLGSRYLAPSLASCPMAQHQTPRLVRHCLPWLLHPRPQSPSI